MNATNTMAAALNAVRLPDGDYAYYDDGVRAWYVVSEASALETSDQDYSVWCSHTDAERMPASWTPRGQS